MAIILPANTLAASGFSVDNSCRFNGDAYLHKTVGTPTNADKYTLSVWIKRSILTSFGPDNAQYIMSYDGGGNPREHIRFNDSTDTLNWYFRDSGGTATNLTTTQEFRDVSAWYHFVFVYDSGQAVAANRQTIYCNGAEITSFSSSGYVAQDTDSNLNSNVSVKIGAIGTGSPSVYSSQYLSEVVFLDGQTLAASNFGEYDEDSPTIWKPKDVSGLTFGDNGFYLDFEASDNLGNDANGGTDWTEVTLAATDQSTDSPTNNFCTMNPLANSFDPATFSEGNLSIVTETDGQSFKTATFGLSTGKWYWEIFRRGANGHSEIGIAGMPSDAADDYLGADAFTYAVHSDDGNWFTNGSGTSWVSAHNSAGTYPDHVCMVALDLDNNKFYFGINGTWEDSGDPTSGATGTGAQSIAAASTTPTGVWFPAISDKHNSYNTTLDMNFGGGAAFGATAVASANQDADGFGNFEFSVPSGYFSICSKNLAEYG